MEDPQLSVVEDMFVKRRSMTTDQIHPRVSTSLAVDLVLAFTTTRVLARLAMPERREEEAGVHMEEASTGRKGGIHDMEVEAEGARAAYTLMSAGQVGGVEADGGRLVDGEMIWIDRGIVSPMLGVFRRLKWAMEARMADLYVWRYLFCILYSFFAYFFELGHHTAVVLQATINILTVLSFVVSFVIMV